MENNLNELNNLLFGTLRDIKNDKIDIGKANAIVGISNSIIANAKTQLNAYKLTKGHAYRETFGDLEPAPSQKALKSDDKYTQKNEFALFKGYKSVTDAMSKIGKPQFEREFQNWIKQALR